MRPKLQAALLNGKTDLGKLRKLEARLQETSPAEREWVDQLANAISDGYKVTTHPSAFAYTSPVP
jgi:hypothetical protein